MSRTTGLEHLNEGSNKERLKNFFKVKGFKTDMDITRDEIEEEVAFELGARQFYNELENRENDIVQQIKTTLTEERDLDEIPEAFWKI